MNLRIFFGALLHLVFSASVYAQCTLLASAVPGITLVHQNTNCFNNSGVAYNPNQGLYYACRAGNSGFPYETWSSTGTPLFNTNTGNDFRGLWWNPALNKLEGNSYNGAGIWNSNLNASGYALNTGAMVLASGQPNAQSCGDLDWQAYEILYYSAGSIYRYSRTTGAFLGSYPITGTPVALANLNSTTLMFTGCAGQEIALLDYVNKRVYLYNKATGAYSGVCQLPAGAVTAASFRVSWANNLIWLFNLANYTWYSYQVFSVPLPVELVSFAGTCDDGKVILNWSTASETNNDHYTLERTSDGITYSEIARVPGSGNSSQMHAYSFRDEDAVPGVYFYRLKQFDYDGAFTTSEIISVDCDDQDGGISLYPNPNHGSFVLNGCTAGDVILILDAYGNEVYRENINSSGPKEIVLTGFAPGVYTLRLSSPARIISKRLIIN